MRGRSCPSAQWTSKRTGVNDPQGPPLRLGAVARELWSQPTGALVTARKPLQQSDRTPHPAYVSVDGDDLLLRIKAVPGASRDAIAGMLGDRLKVRVSAAPEEGRANAAICALIAASLQIRSRLVTVEIGATSPEKVLRVAGLAGRIDVVAGERVP